MFCIGTYHEGEWIPAMWDATRRAFIFSGIVF